MCTYMYTYVYVVLSDGTRGCCGLIYRLSLPWKPRRDRLARHPHIRVDSGLLYSPPRLTRFCSHPPTSPLYTHRSISYSSSLLIFSPPSSPLTSLRPPLSVRLYPLSPPLLSSFTVHAIYVPSSHATPSLFLSLFLSLCTLRTSSCLSKRVFLTDSSVLSFFCRIIPSRFRVFYASFLPHHPAPRSRCSTSIVSSPSHPLNTFLTSSFASTRAHFLSRSNSPRPLRISSFVSLHPFGLLLAHSLLRSLHPLSSSQRTSTTAHPRHHPVTSPIALFHAPDRECALISHSLSLRLLLALSLPLFLSFTSPLFSSLFIYSLTLPNFLLFAHSHLPFDMHLRHYRPPSRGRNSLEKRQGAECRRNPPQGTAHLRNLPSAMPSITLTAYTIFLLSLAIDMIPSVQITKTSLIHTC